MDNDNNEPQWDESKAYLPKHLLSGVNPHFGAWATYLLTVIMTGPPKDVKELHEMLQKLYLLAQPDTEADMTVFTDGLQAKLKSHGLSDQEADCIGAAVTFSREGKKVMEFIALGGKKQSVMTPGSEYEKLVINCAAEAAAEAGYTLDLKAILEQQGGMIGGGNKDLAEALSKAAQAKIDRETAKFREELDAVFDTWKGGGKQ